MGSIWQDLRLGIRGLIKSPGFTVVAVVTLALGIGANTAMFTVLNAVLLRALPVEDPQRFVILSNPAAHGIGSGDGSGVRNAYAYTEFQDLRDQNQVFSGIFAADSRARRIDITIGNANRSGEPEQAAVTMVSGDYFRVLGIRPFRGRTFTTDVDKVQHANPVAVISYDYWKNRFAQDPSIIGRKIQLRRTTCDIIGVAQRGFTGETIGASTDIWVPLTMQVEVFPAWTNFLDKPADPLNKIEWLQIMARLKPGMTLAQAQVSINLTLRHMREADVAGMSAERRREYMDSRIHLVDGSRGATDLDETEEPLKILMAVVGLVLLIACANVANLVLARGAGRRREIALRVALGAGRLRLLQQLMTESLLLAVAGGALGLILAQWGDVLLLRMVSSESDPVLLDLHPDPAVFAFTLGVSVLTGVLFGLLPGLRAVRLDLNSALKGAARGATRGGSEEGRVPAGRMLVAAQIAVSLSVLIVAGLFVHSFQKLAVVNPGFDHDHILQFDLGFLEASGYKGTAAIHQVHTELLARLQTTPQVKGATLAFMGLFAGNDTGFQISLDGSRPKSDEAHRVRNDLVPANHFAAIGQPLLAGREISSSDERSQQLFGVINQTLARKFFGNANPIGKRIWFSHDHPDQFEVVGIVADAKHNTLREEPMPEFWLPFFRPKDNEPSFCSFQVRYWGDKAPVVPAIRAAVKEVAPAVPPVQVRTMNELMGETLIFERVITQLSSFFGVLALVLASIGLYGVMAYRVTGRINEIGIRVALGARPGDILRIVLRETLILIAIGVALGLPSIMLAKRYVSSLLFGVTALDPIAIAGATLLLASVAVLAGYIPARWASRVDPTVALRYEG
jgi:predicted permease